jgi:tellurium resistance protein TerD
MALSLSKGANISLTKEAPSLNNANVGLGWDARSTDGTDFDLDAAAFLIGADGKVRSDADFIFYNQPSDAAGSVVHKGDNKTGAGDGDDEVVDVDLSLIPADIEKVVFTVTIHEGQERGQSFGQVSNAYIRVVNSTDGTEITRYDLGEDYAQETALIFAELYRYNGDWKFKAVGAGFNDGLAGLARNFGINL